MGAVGAADAPGVYHRQKEAVMSGELPLPAFYEPANAGRWGYAPDQQALFEAALRWRAEHGLASAASDRRRVLLLVVDAQKDFCLPEGTLFVGGRSGRGAIDDSDRLARFVYRNLARITGITCTMDTHLPFQVFSPAFWLDAAGAPLSAHREVLTEDIASGRVRPNPDLAAWLAGGDLAWLQRQVAFYCRQLERAGKYRLYLWPPHCLLGSDGHALVGVVHEARLFHAYARSAPDGVEVKGTHPLTEHYSVLAPEVLARHDGGTLAERNTAFTDTLLAADALVVAGQAASHCVKSTLEDLLDAIRQRDPRLALRVYVLRDCMSSVAVPDPAQPGSFLFDFTPQTEAALARLAEAGMHLVESTRPMEEWPEMG
jgi:nicotinamidase-related amidase